MAAMFSSVCEATCPRLSPVASASAPRARRDAPRRCDHQPPIDHDAGGRRDRQHDLALDLAERHQDRAASAYCHSVSRSTSARALACEVSRQVRHAVEVHEDHAAAALHHPPGRHRRVDAARQQRGHGAAGADRQAARPGRRSSDTNASSGRTSTTISTSERSRSRASSGTRSSTKAPRARFISTLVMGIRLEGAPRADAEGARTGGPHEAPDRGLHRVQGRRRCDSPARRSPPRTRAAAGRVPPRAADGLEIEHDAAGPLAQRHRPRSAVARRRLRARWRRKSGRLPRLRLISW